MVGVVASGTGEARAAAIGDQLAERGFSGPIRVLDAGAARRLRWRLEAVRRVRPGAASWPKGWAAASVPFYRVAADPAVLDLVEAVIGPDIAVWGASLQVRRAGRDNRWHTDMESAQSAVRSVSVWIPLQHPGPGSSLLALPGTQALGVTVQQVAADMHRRPEELNGADLEAAAARYGLRTGVETITPSDGEAVLFDGGLWHASINHTARTRVSLLLQYALPDADVRVPIPGRWDWPFEDSGVQAPTVLVRGRARTGLRPTSPPPGRARRGRHLTARTEPIGPPISGVGSWGSRSLFSGSTATGLQVAAHASTLAPGHTPHPPHTHAEEEVLVVLEGRLEVQLTGHDGHTEVIGSGDVVHYPLQQGHTITACGTEPAHYAMVKWAGSRVRRRSLRRLGAQIAHNDDPPIASMAITTGWSLQTLFEGPTGYLAMLHCHRSVMAPGGGYAPHADAYDVAIVTLDGTVETLGREVGPHTVIWYPMGSRHGLRNVGDHPARYVVFEFHGANLGSRLSPQRARHAAGRALRLPQRAARRLRAVAPAT